MGSGSRKESWFSERNCSALALMLGNACFSTACRWWFRGWHEADVNQCSSFTAADLCYLKIWPHIFFCVHICQKMIFFSFFFLPLLFCLKVKLQALFFFFSYKKITNPVVSNTKIWFFSEKLLWHVSKMWVNAWQNGGLFAKPAFPGKVCTHPEIDLLPRVWISCLLCWENAAAWSMHWYQCDLGSLEECEWSSSFPLWFYQ